MANSNDQSSSDRGGDHATHEQHVKAGQQSHKNDESSNNANSDSGGTRGGSSEQHAKAGSQSHKNK